MIVVALEVRGPGSKTANSPKTSDGPMMVKRVFENSRWAGVCLAENRRSRLLVGSVITKSPPRPGAHNAIIADLAMPVVPAPRGGRTWLRGVLVVGDRRRVGDPRTAVACAGQHGRPRRATREALPPCDSGRHPVHRARWYRVAATAGGVPASRDGVRGLRPLGPQRAWQRILDALRDRLRVRAGRDRCPTAAIIDSQTVPAADTVPRSSRGWDGGKRMNGVKRHIAVDVNGLLLAVVVTAASIQDRDAAHDSWPHCAAASPPSGWSGPTAVTPDGCSSGRKTFSPLLCRSSNASPAPLVSTSGPAFG